MPKVEVKTTEKMVLVQRLEKAKEYIFTLSEEEARAMLTVCGLISGAMDGPRKIFMDIYNELGAFMGLRGLDDALEPTVRFQGIQFRLSRDLPDQKN